LYVIKYNGGGGQQIHGGVGWYLVIGDCGLTDSTRSSRRDTIEEKRIRRIVRATIDRYDKTFNPCFADLVCS